VVARTESSINALANGDYADFFAAAAKYHVPVGLFCPGNAQMVRRYAESQPENIIVLDHIGIPKDDQQFEDVLRLASLPNVVIKWGTHLRSSMPMIIVSPRCPLSRPRYRCLRCRPDHVGERLYRAHAVKAAFTVGQDARRSRDPSAPRSAMT